MRLRPSDFAWSIAVGLIIGLVAAQCTRTYAECAKVGGVVVRGAIRPFVCVAKP